MANQAKLSSNPTVSSRFREQSRLVRFLRNPDSKGYLFIAPWVLGFLGFSLWPLLTTFYNSFTRYNLYKPAEWIGLDNYQQILFSDEVFGQVVQNMLFYVVASTIVTTGGGLMLATLLSQKVRGGYFFRTVIYVPTLMGGLAVGMLFKQIFNGSEIGLANQFLGLFGIGPIKWLTDYNNVWLSILAVVLVNLWYMGTAMLVFTAGIKNIPPAYYEAARIDGASGFRLFRHLTLPLLAPVIVFDGITALITHTQVFEIPLTFATNGGGGNPLGYHNSLGTFLSYIYTKAFKYQEFGYGSALACVVFAITLVLTLIVLWLAARYTYYGDQVRN